MQRWSSGDTPLDTWQRLGKLISNNMVFIQNYDRMYHVGRTFGSIMMDKKVVPCRTLFGSFGNPVRLEHDWKTAENPYTV